MALKYTGTPGTDYIPGVPARDLTTDEEKKYPLAAESPFYKRVPIRRSEEN